MGVIVSQLLEEFSEMGLLDDEQPAEKERVAATEVLLQPLAAEGKSSQEMVQVFVELSDRIFGVQKLLVQQVKLLDEVRGLVVQAVSAVRGTSISVPAQSEAKPVPEKQTAQTEVVQVAMSDEDKKARIAEIKRRREERLKAEVERVRAGLATQQQQEDDDVSDEDESVENDPFDLPMAPMTVKTKDGEVEVAMATEGVRKAKPKERGSNGALPEVDFDVSFLGGKE